MQFDPVLESLLIELLQVLHLRWNLGSDKFAALTQRQAIFFAKCLPLQTASFAEFGFLRVTCIVETRMENTGVAA
jgi:hypothetical protein